MTLLTLLSSRAGSTILLSAAMTGSGTLSPSIIAKRSVAAAIVGDGYVASSPLIAVRPLSRGLVGDGYLASSPLVATRVLGASFAGDGFVTPSLVATRPLSAQLSGSGSLAGAIGALKLLSIGMGSSSALGASLSTVRAIASQLAGSGRLAAPLSPPSLSVLLAGSGVLDCTLGVASVGGTEEYGYPRRRFAAVPSFLSPPTALAIEEVEYSDQVLELAPVINLVGRVGFSGQLEAVLSVYRPLPDEPRLEAPAPPDVFPWWEQPTEDELAFLLAIA